MNNKNLYSVIGVDPSATDAEIKKAYKAKAQALHPDRGDGDKEAFQELTEAYKVLSNGDKRKHYDATGDAPDLRPQGGDELRALAGIFNALIEQFGAQSLAHIDVIGQTRKIINEGMRVDREAIGGLELNISDLEKASGLMKRQKNDLFSNVIRDKIKGINAQIDAKRQKIQIGENMLELLKEFEFENQDPFAGATNRFFGTYTV